MSKNLIINRLNKCKAFQFDQSEINKDGSISKISTSTKTQESPQLLNPQFTFKAADFQKLNQKNQIRQFFNDFNPNEQISYKKVVLKKPKVLQRSLEFELMNLYRQGKQIQEYTAIKKLQFPDEEEIERDNSSLEKRFKMQQNQQQLYQGIKTEYVRGRECKKYINPGHKEYFEDNLPYDCRKYKLQREKLCVNKEQKLTRCFTEAEPQSFVQNPSYLSDAYYESLNNASKPFNDNHFKSLDIQENQSDFLNQYYFKNGTLDSNRQDHNNKLFAKKSNSMGIHVPKRQGNSSRLSFFRKEREQQIRRSLLEQHNQSKHHQFMSNENKENIENSSTFIPSLPLNNQIAQNKKLQGQFSERYLFDRRLTFESGPKKLSYHIPKSSLSYINKQNESRIHSIRNQLKDIYQIRDEDRSRLKIKRDQQIFQQTARNQLRKIGSICRL